MKVKKTNKNLLIMGKGDSNYSDRNPRRVYEHTKRAGFDVHRLEYGETFPDFDNESNFNNGLINVFFFFPYRFWNENCEVPKDTELYGTSGSVCDILDDFFLEMKCKLEGHYQGHELNFVIDPLTASSDRDKVGIVEKLRQAGVPTTEILPCTSLQEIIGEITPQKGIFVKCRYGAEGKGITFLGFSRWKTNYKVEGYKIKCGLTNHGEERLTNYEINDNWQFTDITGREELIEQLLQNDVVVEREIVSPPFFAGKKFDIRAYVVAEEVVYYFARLNDWEKVITNYSQGGRVKHHPEEVLPEKSTEIIKETALQTARALGSSFIGVDMMFDGSLAIPKVVEVQTFTDFPDIRYFNLAKYLARNHNLLFE